LFYFKYNFKYIHFFHRTKEYFLYRQLKDTMKIKFCKNKFNLLIIHYNDFKNIKQIINNILSSVGNTPEIYYSNKIRINKNKN
jgi:hypothetical protein